MFESSMREKGQRLGEEVRGGTGQWPQQTCGQEIFRSLKLAVHYIVSESPPLGPLLCSAKRIRSALPLPFLQDLFQTSFHIVLLHGCTNLGTRSPVQLNFVRLSLMFMGPQYRNCFMFPFWRLEF